jgi:CDP-diacylglycerol--serine O-phosphatidyltransferase
MKQEGIKKGIYILPNLFTTANMFCGYFSIMMTIKGDYVMAAWMIVLAGLFDFLDGRVARLTNTSSDFGVQYDSFSDLTSFGLASSILMYKWLLIDFGRFGAAACFLFFACGALRLARFNVQSESVEKKNFQGMPIPSAAGCIVSYIIFHEHYLDGKGPLDGVLVLALTFLLALLMVSSVPYKSFKVKSRNSKTQFFSFVMAIVMIFVVASAPELMLFVIGMVYLLSGLLLEISKSPKRIRSFADFMRQFFQYETESPKKEKTKKESPTLTEEKKLKVVGMNKNDND